SRILALCREVAGLRKLSALIQESQIGSISSEEKKRLTPLLAIREGPCRGERRAFQPQTPGAAGDQIAGSFSGIFDQACGGGTGITPVIDPGDVPPIVGAVVRDTYLRHRARRGTALEYLSIHGSAVRVFRNLDEDCHTRIMIRRTSRERRNC